MATYSDIQAWIKNKYGYSIETCWIAHAKEVCGLEVRLAANRLNVHSRKKPCPTDKLGVIKEAFRNFGMI